MARKLAAGLHRRKVSFIIACLVASQFMAFIPGHSEYSNPTDLMVSVNDKNIDINNIQGDEFFISPLTYKRYSIIKDIDMGLTVYCLPDGSLCYDSVSEILTEESENMPRWMAVVEPKLRDRVVKGLDNKDDVKLIIELEGRYFQEIANGIWNAKNPELDELTNKVIMSERVENTDSASFQDETNSNDRLPTSKRYMLEDLDMLLDETRSDIYERASAVISKKILSLADQIETRGGTFRSWTPVLPAMFVSLPLDEIPFLSDLGEIARVSEDTRMSASLDVSAYAIAADQWWSQGYTGGTWDLAVVDTGIDGTHPALDVDLESVFHVTGKWDPAYNDNESSTDDLHGHGTHIAGIVASSNATNKGIAHGLDLLINAKAGWRTTGSLSYMYWSDAMQAIDWAVGTGGADVITLSFGDSTSSGDTPFARFFDAVVDNLGIPVTISAGNDGPSIGTVREPAIGYNIFSVANIDDKNTADRADDLINPGSSQGPTADGRTKPDLAAPGTGIFSANHDWEGANPDFRNMTGTSMAAPHVAASVILLMDYKGSAFVPVYKALLLNSAEDRGSSGPDNTYGWGYLDLSQAFSNRDMVFDDTIDEDSYKFYRGSVVTGSRATMVWNRHALYAGSDYPTTYYALNDLDLYGFDESNNLQVDLSTSSVNNVEQVTADAGYSSFVYKVKAHGSFEGVAQEQFAIALDNDVVQANPPFFIISISVPASSEVGDTFEVTTTITNRGGLMAHNVWATINLPSGLTLSSGGNPQFLMSIGSDESENVTWIVRGDTLGSKTINITVTSNSYLEDFSDISSNHDIDIVDTTPPSSAVDPLPSITGEGSFGIAATASDTGGGIYNVELFYRKDGHSWTSYDNDTAPPWSWNFDTALTSGDGYYEFYSIATDDSLNKESAPGSPDTYTIVDSNAPQSAANPLPVYKKSDSFVVTAVAVDQGSNISQVELYFKLGQGSWSSYGSDPDAPWSWDFNTASTGGDGSYQFYTIATDDAGNTELPPQYNDTWTVVDTLGPVSSVSSLPAYQTSHVFDVPYSASDPGSGIKYIELYYTEDYSISWEKYGTRFYSSPISFDASAAQGDGVYGFFTVATDNLDQTETGGEPTSGTIPDASTCVDTEAPYVSISAPSMMEWMISSTVTIKWSGSDEGSGVDRFEIVLDNTTTTLMGTLTSKTYFSLNDGLRTVMVHVYDKVGNHGEAYVNFTVDTTPPDLVITYPSEGSVISSSDFEVEWTGTDETSGIQYYKLKIDDGEYLNMSLTTSYQVTDIADGSHTISINAVDYAGNSVITAITFLVDTGQITFDDELDILILYVILIIIIIAIFMIIFIVLFKRKGKSKNE